jgi:hypothetical protein
MWQNLMCLRANWMVGGALVFGFLLASTMFGCERRSGTALVLRMSTASVALKGTGKHANVADVTNTHTGDRHIVIWLANDFEKQESRIEFDDRSLTINGIDVAVLQMSPGVYVFHVGSSTVEHVELGASDLRSFMESYDAFDFDQNTDPVWAKRIVPMLLGAEPAPDPDSP